MQRSLPQHKVLRNNLGCITLVSKSTQITCSPSWLRARTGMVPDRRRRRNTEFLSDVGAGAEASRSVMIHRTRSIEKSNSLTSTTY